MGMLDDIRAKYPDYNDLSDQQLTDAIHGKFYSDMPREEFNARVGVAAKPQAEVRSYEPTIREKIGGYISDFFNNSAEGDRLAQGVVGSSGLGHTSMGVTDFTPARIPMFAQEGFRAYNEGRMGEAALSALGATPIPVLNNAAGAVARVAEPITEPLMQAAGRLSTQVAARMPRSLTGSTADDVADRVIAGRLQRSGQSAGTVAEDLEAGQRSARLGSNSQAVLPEMLADTSDNMQRLTGSVYRTGGEASEIVKPRLEGRQKGPANFYADRVDDMPQGQIERVIDDFDRALEIKSSKGSRATAQELITNQKAKANELYGKARANSEAFDLDPVNTGWRMKAMQYQGDFKSKMDSAIDLFSRPAGSFKRFDVDTVERFDNAKKVLDDMIERSKEMGKPTNLTRELTLYKKDLIGKVEEGGKNKFYRQAREEFGTDADDLEALDLGKTALREDSAVTLDDFRALTPAQKKLFRIGMRDALRLKYATSKPGDNATLPLQQRRVREILSEAIPTPRAKNAEFADRAKRFGDLMQREERMNQTRNVVLGGSPTGQRLADDAEFASDTLSRMVTSSRSFLNMGLELVGTQLQKVFGYRRDVAAALARKLTSTDPAERAATLEAIRAAQTPQAFSAFAEGISRAVPRAPAVMAPTAPDQTDIGGGAGVERLGGGPEGDTLSGDPYDQIPITADGNEAQAREQQAKGYAANRQRVQDRSLVTYGDQQVIPNNIDDTLDMMTTGLSRAGEVMSAFPAVGGLIDEAGDALGAGLRYARSKPPVPQDIIPGATKEGDAILAAQRAKRDAARAAQAQAAEDAAKVARGAAYQAEAAKRGSTGTVPALSPTKDRAAILEGLPENTAPMAIKGRQGMPTRDEQIDLVDKYLSMGGRARDLPPGNGPWGPSPQGQSDRAREAIQRAWNEQPRPPKGRTVPDNYRPSVGELAEAYRGAKAEAVLLREKIARLSGKAENMVSKEEIDSLRGLLKETQMDLISLQKAQKEAPRRAYQPKWPDPDDVTDIPGREPPRVYRKGQ